MKPRIVYSAWYSYKECIKCTRHLTDGQYSHNRGICPHCGYVSNGTFCAAKTYSARTITTHTGEWWQFWKRPEVRVEVNRD